MSMKKSTALGYRFLRWKDGSTIADIPFDKAIEMYGAPYYLVHRADLHAALLDAALKAGVQVHRSQQVVSYDFSVPQATTSDGAVWTADILICADGSSTCPIPQRLVLY